MVYAITLPISPVLQLVIGSVWPLAVALFFLPVYQCTELGYFDTAKRTSGVGADLSPAGGTGWDSF